MYSSSLKSSNVVRSHTRYQAVYGTWPTVEVGTAEAAPTLEAKDTGDGSGAPA